MGSILSKMACPKDEIGATGERRLAAWGGGGRSDGHSVDGLLRVAGHQESKRGKHGTSIKNFNAA
jgi:hypothetical protein